MRLIQETLGAHATLTGYLHTPSKEMGNIHDYPAILVLPGGGFRICSDREAEPVAMAFFAEGYQAFVLDYTTVTKNPEATMADAMADCNGALEYLRSHSEEYHIVENKLAMIGFSGGGHLASAQATHGPQRPDALVLGYPGIVHNDTRALDCPDIIESVDEQMPPCFLFSTRDDKVTPPKHVLAMVQALTEHDIDYELHIFRSGVHGLSLGKALTSAGDRLQVNETFQSWFPMCITWLKAKLGEFTIYGVNDGRIGRFSIDTPVASLLANEDATQIATEAIPMLAQMAQNPMAASMTIRQAAGYLPQITEEVLNKLDADLLALG